jgi:hypothetical protein
MYFPIAEINANPYLIFFVAFVVSFFTSMGIKKVMGIVLSENTKMLKLGKKMGFSKTQNPESREYDLNIDLKLESH